MKRNRSVSPTRTHKLTVTGGKSYSLVIPIEFVRHLKWKEKQNLNVTLTGEHLVITDWKK